MKRQLKRLAEDAVARIAPLNWRTRRAPKLLVLMYHRVLPSEHPDRRTEQPGMYVSPQTLAMHLAVLNRSGFAVVRLDEWLDKARDSQPLPRLACALTFDDGWRDNYEHAFPVLKAAQAHATIYLVSDLVGSRYSFWPNALARILARCTSSTLAAMPDWLQQTVKRVAIRENAGLDAVEIDAVLSACKSAHSDAEMLSTVQVLHEHVGDPQGLERDLLSWAEVQEMQSSGLVTFGSHTRRHTRLTDSLPAAALADEVVGSLQALEQKLGSKPRTFCFPNGDTSAAAVSLVRTVYSAALTTKKGWHDPGQDAFLIQRIGVHEDISNRPEAFLARISGWL
jgi:peptidoglycan/xylan/chitin deacetylase (PgdA/CDA1 family)